MRLAFIGLGATITILPCLCLLAAGQDKGAQSTASEVSKDIKPMRRKANTNARAFATAAQAHAVKSGKYENVITDCAKDIGARSLSIHVALREPFTLWSNWTMAKGRAPQPPPE
jgi:hypothetical protein